MSIRQIRINSQEQIRQRMKEFIGKKIQIVFTDQTSAIGELISVENDGIILLNGRLNKNQVSYTKISELYFDQII